MVNGTDHKPRVRSKAKKKSTAKPKAPTRPVIRRSGSR
jgi:hypothetical protein